MSTPEEGEPHEVVEKVSATDEVRAAFAALYDEYENLQGDTGAQLALVRAILAAAPSRQETEGE